jgi:hypothetical protein
MRCDAEKGDSSKAGPKSHIAKFFDEFPTISIHREASFLQYYKSFWQNLKTLSRFPRLVFHWGAIPVPQDNARPYKARQEFQKLI